MANMPTTRITLVFIGVLLLCSSVVPIRGRMATGSDFIMQVVGGEKAAIMGAGSVLRCVGKGEQCGPDPQYWCCGLLWCPWASIIFDVPRCEL